MNKTTMILSAVMLLAMIVVIAPNIISANRGKMLRNIALWLAIFTGLSLIYKNFGPGSEHPMFALPAGMIMEKPVDVDKGADKPGSAKADTDKKDGDQGYSPPAE